MDALRGLFLKLDKNKDGFISVAELHNEMKKTGILSVDEKARSVISQFDQDDDGRLSYEEFLSYMMNSEKKWKIHFQDLDRNKCGEIGEEEIIHLFKELGVVISKPNAKRIIQMIDKDNSMTVDWEEFLHHVILNPAENLGELVSSWKHSLVFDVGESRAMPLEFPEEGPDSGMWRRFVLAAGLADAVSRTVTAPIDRLKTQLQVYGSKTFSEGFRSLKEGGVRAMWQGNAVNVLKGTPQSTLQCLIYAQMKVSTLSLRGQDSLSVLQRFGLGCFSGAVAHAVFYPLEVLKVHLNLQQAGAYSGVLGGARLFFRNGSVASFYRGFKPSILCMIPYAGVECAVHQSIISWAKSDPVYSSDYKIFFFSFVAFACGQVTSYPLAVIRTQRQAQAFSLHLPTSSVLQGLIGIYERHGIRGYYNGMGASFVRAVPCALLNYTLTTKLEMLLSTL